MAPHVQRLMEMESGSGWRLALKELGDIARVLLALPKRTDELLTRVDQGRVDIRVPEMRQHFQRLEHSVRKLGAAIVFAAGLVAGTNLYLGGHLEIALGFAVAEVVLLGWILFGR